MEPKDDSIKLLEMRIRHQMNRSLEKKIMPDSIHYYLSSSTAQRSEDQQNIRGDEQGQPRQAIHVDGKGNLWQEIQTEEEDLLQAEYSSETPEDDWPEEDLPFNAAEYIDRASEISQMIEHIEISETKEVQHAKARNGYESVRRSIDEEQSSEIGKKHFLDAKG